MWLKMGLHIKPYKLRRGLPDGPYKPETKVIEQSGLNKKNS